MIKKKVRGGHEILRLPMLLTAGSLLETDVCEVPGFESEGIG
jgi:hypothetical protein